MVRKKGTMIAIGGTVSPVSTSRNSTLVSRPR
jgi:hypothetical protein